MKKRIISLLMVFLLISACVPHKNETTIDLDSTTPTFTVPPTLIPEGSSTPIPITLTPSLQSQICSPLEGESLLELSEIITQSFKMPRVGQDDGHHGVDFAFYRRKNLLSIDGLPIHSALNGEVVTIINDKYPYGNALIIETKLDSISSDIIDQLNIQTIQPTVMPDPKFKWSPGKLSFPLDESSRSIYIYYAHLKNPVAMEIGELVKCGQEIGQVGNTGDSSNPHLHFEIRIGPSGAKFESMAYYTAQSTESERYNYVAWRVSNIFQLIDPMMLLSIRKE